jgi:hypothetical protein
MIRDVAKATRPASGAGERYIVLIREDLEDLAKANPPLSAIIQFISLIPLVSETFKMI